LVIAILIPQVALVMSLDWQSAAIDFYYTTSANV